jgi:preprotein translocase subunit SecG
MIDDFTHYRKGYFLASVNGMLYLAWFIFVLIFPSLHTNKDNQLTNNFYSFCFFYSVERMNGVNSIFAALMSSVKVHGIPQTYVFFFFFVCCFSLIVFVFVHNSTRTQQVQPSELFGAMSSPEKTKRVEQVTDMLRMAE